MEIWYADVSVAMQYQTRIKLHSSGIYVLDVFEEPATTIFMAEGLRHEEEKVKSSTIKNIKYYQAVKTAVFYLAPRKSQISP
jgi:hypothetical protein